MALTRDYKETIRARAEMDPDFARALMQEALTAILNGEPETARIILRELVNSTIGFERIADELEKPSKSIHRMLSAHGNPTMDNLAGILFALQKGLNTKIHVNLSYRSKASKRTAGRDLA